MPKAPENLREFTGLLKVVEFLRGPDGCPWDKEQTHSTLTRFAIEEAFELSEAIDGGDVAEIKDELGDLLLQVVLHAEIARQDGKFDIYDVIQNLSEKMVRRHPHVFSDVKVKDSDHVIENWTAIKAKEKAAKGASSAQPLSFDVPSGMPALLKSQKIGEKTKKTGFDWQNASQVWEKVKEEFNELAFEVQHSSIQQGEGNLERVMEEMGDLLFSLAQLARHVDMDSEQALRITNQRFEKRYFAMQELVRLDGKDWLVLTPEEKEKYWQQAKDQSAAAGSKKPI